MADYPSALEEVTLYRNFGDIYEEVLHPAGGGAVIYYRNMIWDTGGPGWVYWTSSSAPDTAGGSFVSPWGTSFAACTNYCSLGAL